MKPHRARDTARPASLARARLLLKAHLGWLRGFPAAEPRVWMRVPEPGSEQPVERVVLEPRHLRDATRALHTLVREHHDALAEITGDAARWHERSLALLGELKPCVHGAKWVGATKSDGLSTLQRALEWLYAREPRALKRGLAHAESAAEPLTNLLALGSRSVWPTDAPSPLELAVRLMDLARADGMARVLPFLNRLADVNAYCVPLMATTGTAGPAATVTARRKGKARDWPQTPLATLGESLVRLATRLPSWETSRRRRTLALFALVDPGKLLERWARNWDQHDTLVREADELLPHATVPRASRRLTAIQRAFKRLDDTRPPSLDGAALVRAVETVSSAPAAAAMTKLLERIPERTRRIHMRMHMLFVCEHGLGANTELLTRELERLLGATGDPAIALSPWWECLQIAHLPARREHFTPHADFADEKPDAIRAFFAALHAGHARAGAAISQTWRARPQVLLLEALATLTHDGPRADRLVQQLVNVGIYHAREGVLRAALALAPHDEPRFAALVKTLEQAIGSGDEIDDADPLGLAWAFGNPSTAERIASLVLGGETPALMRIGGRGRVLTALGARPPDWEPVTQAAASTWMDRYPAQLLEPLTRLASVDPRAKESAASLLGNSYPAPEELTNEMRALRERLAEATGERARRMRARLDNLEKRLRSPVSSSSAAVAEERDALAKLTERRALAAWERAHDAAVGTVLLPLLGTLPDWVLAPPCIELLPHLCALDKASRKLAFRLLKARTGPYPWDLRDEPANRVFLDALERKGIDAGPWIEGIGLFATETPRGVAYLQLERDPLECLQMGKHFETCLSPGWFNFFSAVSNAADINKRVLFGRDADGTVMGRCLLALTDEGAVLSFHAYCHDEAAWGFSKLVSRFVADLCERMETQPAFHGQVSNLVCKRWYDDGPVDITGSFSWMNHDSEGYRRIGGSDPDSLLEVVHAVIAPLELNALTLPLVIGMPIFDQHPELAVPLVDVVRSTGELALPTKLRVAELAWRAGAHDEVRRLCAALAPDLERRPKHLPASSFQLLLDVGEPALVLRMLKNSRPRGIRSLSQELDVERLAASARACELLHRPSRALALYRRAAQRSSGDMRTHFQARIAELA